MVGKIIVLLLSFSWIVACQPNAGLLRTNFDKFHTKNYLMLGFSLDLPVHDNGSSGSYREVVYDSDIYKQNSKTLGELSLAFYPIYGTHQLSEPVYIISLSVARLSEQQFGLFKDKRHYLINNPCFQEISPRLSNNLTEKYVFDSYNRREYECRYKTITIENGDILVCLGQILLEDESNLESDIQQLRSMMNSISILQ